MAPGRLAAGLGLGLLRVCGAVLPAAWLDALSRAGTRALLRLAPRLRAALGDNASHLLGARATPAEREALSLAVLRSFARFATEIVSSPGAALDGLSVEDVTGREHYERAAAAGRGVIGVTLHMGNYEAGALLLARVAAAPVAIVYTRDPTGLFERTRSRLRRAHGVREVEVGGSRPLFALELLDVLRRGGAALLAGDLGFEAEGAGGASLYPFLGGRAPFLALPARLALATGAPLLPCFCLRDRRRLRLEIAPPIFPAEAGSADAAMARLLAVFVEYVRRYPDQWLIVHRYFA